MLATVLVALTCPLAKLFAQLAPVSQALVPAMYIYIYTQTRSFARPTAKKLCIPVPGLCVCVDSLLWTAWTSRILESNGTSLSTASTCISWGMPSMKNSVDAKLYLKGQLSKHQASELCNLTLDLALTDTLYILTCRAPSSPFAAMPQRVGLLICVEY